jgi:fatty acid desaturase
MLPPAYFRAFHFAHHRHTQDPARDPELAAPKPASLGGYLLLVSGLPYWRERLVTVSGHAAGRVRQAFIAKPQAAAVVREARLLLAVYGAVAGLSLAAGSWAAALLGQPWLRMYLLAEHTGCPLVPDMLENSRTTRSNAVVRWLVWNMPYHSEHHSYPALPFHALPAAHGLLRERIAIRASGYLAVQREIIAGLTRRPWPRFRSAGR